MGLQTKSDIHMFQRAAACATLLAAAIGLVACGGSQTAATPDPAPPATTPPATTPPATTPAPAKYSVAVADPPLSVGVEVDSARATTTPIAAARGGSVTTTGADGTVYTLTVPAQALSADLTITMTPVARFTRLPFNGSDTAAAWGVQLAPAASSFLKPLTLRISPPAGTELPVGQQLPFSWSEGGQGVALAMLDPASASMDLKLMHFSGWAIARHRLGLSASLSSLRDRLGGTAAARLESAFSERMAALRQQVLLGQADSGLLSAQELADFVAQYDAQVVRPVVAAAGQSCANSRLAVNTLLAAGRAMQLLGLEDTYSSQANAIFVSGADLCMAEESTKCTANHIVWDIVPAAFALERTAALFGEADTPAWNAWRDRADQRIDQCHRYRLEMDTSASHNRAGSTGWDFKESMQAHVLLRYSASVLRDSSAAISGTGALNSVAYAVHYNRSCESATGVVQAGSTLQVSKLLISAQAGTLSDFRLVYFPGLNASSHLHVNACGTPQTQVREPLFAWSDTFYPAVLALPAYFDVTDGPILEHWVVTPGSATLATKDFAPGMSTGSIVHQTQTHVTLVHTPGG